MFRSSANLRLAADMRALARVAAPWRAARSSWFDGTPESIEARLAATERVLSYAQGGLTPAHLELAREAAAARAELKEASHRLLVDFLDDGARAFKGSKRVATEVERQLDWRDFPDGQEEQVFLTPTPGEKQGSKRVAIQWDEGINDKGELIMDGPKRYWPKFDEGDRWDDDGKHYHVKDRKEGGRLHTADESTGFGWQMGDEQSPIDPETPGPQL